MPITHTHGRISPELGSTTSLDHYRLESTKASIIARLDAFEAYTEGALVNAPILLQQIKRNTNSIRQIVNKSCFNP